MASITIQTAASVTLFVIAYLHLTSKFLTPLDEENFTFFLISPFSIILPMRDEALNAERIINEVLEEVGEFGNCEIIVVDSNSLDNTSEIAEQTLAYSGVDGSRWKIVCAERSGKSHAVNLAMSNCNSEVIVMIDADVSPDPAGLRNFKFPFKRKHRCSLRYGSKKGKGKYGAEKLLPFLFKRSSNTRIII